ncbi:MAG: DNA mismatch repair protein MutS [Oscillospiraceae bacterium]|nr:DNA mismatch repair protein MutS [Oscillospiraceae bacterium]
MEMLSPMMQQYFNIKNNHQDHILFFRLGDFYEMFFEDAILCSKELELTLTKKECGKDKKAPMCGVPIHAYEGYVAKLVGKGYKVAICEQVENVTDAKGLVKRDVVRVITPGTIIENSILKEDENNYICCLNYSEETNVAGVCFADSSTGELFATDLQEENIGYKIVNELARFLPKEVLVTVNIKKLGFVMSFFKEKLMIAVNVLAGDLFEESVAVNKLLEHFKQPNLENLGIKKISPGVVALGTLMGYLYENQKHGLQRFSSINFYNESQFISFDAQSQKNLDILENSHTKGKRGSLLGVLDKTKTAMGKRLLRKYLVRPLVNVALINKRLSAVEELIKNPTILLDLTDAFSCIFDIERILTKIVFGNTNPRELRNLEFTLRKLPAIKELLKSFDSAGLKGLCSKLDILEDIRTLIDEIIFEEPPTFIKDAGVIKDGHNKSIDELRDLLKNSKNYLAKMECEERKNTGIKTLKIGFNRVFGYYIEVSKLNISLVPEHYVRKQTLANCERYFTQSLKELEEKILTANEKLCKLESQVFDLLVKRIADQTARIGRTATLLAELDVWCSFANVAVANRYTKPIVTFESKLEIKDGRHPMVEALLFSGGFVANDCILDDDVNQVAIITGPNMAGKSTYMKQIALIVIMAQIGCFVPASKAEIGVVDGVFTRIGASDDIVSGQSTFMVEMSEVAYILNNATTKSLVVLDEIGRGTSTYDGMSIARSILEYILDKDACGAKTLFATHYHEITDIEMDFNGVKNYNIAVKKRENDIVFLKRIIKGAANKSYGIEVSKFSKLPERIINRAFEILNELECKHINRESGEKKDIGKKQQDLGDVSKFIEGIDVNVLSPIEAMNALIELKNVYEDVKKR